MFLVRLSLALMLLSLILSACTAQPPLLVEIRPTPAGTTAELQRTAVTPTASAPPAAASPATPTRQPSETPARTQPPVPTSTRTVEEPASPTPAGPAGVSGEICSPGKDPAARTAYFENIESFELTALPIAKNQSGYTVELDPGQYIAYAYLNRPSAPGGLYSEAVACGLTEACDNHNPIVFRVASGQPLNGIDLCDWSAPEHVPPNPAPVDPRLPGMVYRINEVNYFRYDERGQAHFLFSSDSRLILSPNGEMGVFQDYEKNDLFLVKFSTGELFNLTNTPQVYETSYRWEPGLPAMIVFTALKPGQAPDPSAGGLYAIESDGSRRVTLDDENEAANFDLSPDGQSIAYGAGETAWLYAWDSGVTPFDPHEYSPDLPDDLRIASPSWSPDGKRIAWYMRGRFSEQHQEAIGVFNLEGRTFRLIHPWAGDGRGPGYPPGGSWDPAGKWLAVPAWEVDPGRRGIWLVAANNPEREIFLGEASSSPLWSPDGKWLAYHDYRYNESTNQVWLYNPNTGEHLKAALPPQAWAVDW